MVRLFFPSLSKFLSYGLTEFFMFNPIGPQSLDSSRRPEDVFSSPDQLAGELATLTLLPRSRWQTLLKLEVIQVCNQSLFQCYGIDSPLLQQRNKPKEPPKPLEKAPFFLPTLPGVEPRFVIQEKTEEVEKDKKSSRRLKNTIAEAESTFLQKLLGEAESGTCKYTFSFTQQRVAGRSDASLCRVTSI